MKKMAFILDIPLYKNSFFITLGRFLNVIVGFIFWIVAARFYPVGDVGIATGLLSSLYIVIAFSRFGFDFSLIRYIRIKDKNNVLNTSFAITTISSFIIGIIYILGIKFFSEDLAFIQNLNYAMTFILFVITASIVSITGVAFTAFRKADYYFFQNIILAFRVPLLIPLVVLGSFGILGSVGLAYTFSAIFAFLYLKNIIRINFKIDNQFVKESFIFSSGNYLSSVFLTVPTLILPIMVLGILGEVEAAKYYIAFAIGNLVLIIPEALCASLFIEGSHGENLRNNVIRTGIVIYSILIPTVILVYFFGGNLLALVGKEYRDGLELLRFIVLSSLFAPVSSMYISIENVLMKVENIIRLNLFNFLALPILSYFLILKFGTLGIGYALMITYITLDLLVIILIKRRGGYEYKSFIKKYLAVKIAERFR